MVFALACWVVGADDPAHRRGGARPARSTSTSSARPSACCASSRAQPRLWWGGLVISWFWLVGAVVLSLLPTLVQGHARRQRSRRDDLPRRSSRSPSRSAPASPPGSPHGRIVLVPTLIGAVLLGLFALDLGIATLGLAGGHGALTPGEVFGVVQGLARRDRPRRPGRSPAACSSCRRSPPCRPGPAPTGAPASSPPSTCSTPPSWWCRRSPSPSCRRPASAPPTSSCCSASLSLARRRVRSAAPADAAVARLPVDHLPRLLPPRGEGPRERRQGRRRTPIIALNHVSFLDARAGAVDPRQGAGLRHRHRHRPALVGEAVPAADARACRSIRPSRWRRAP